MSMEAQIWPVTFTGVYGSSRYLISSSVSLTSSAPTELCIQPTFVPELTKESILTEDILEVLEARGADDGRRHRLLRQDPSEGDLSHARALLLGDLLDPRNTDV